MFNISVGVRIFSDPTVEDYSQRIWLSSGTHQDIKKNTDMVKYAPDSFIPKLPWRTPSEQEASILMASEPFSNNIEWNQGTNIGILKFPQKVLEPLEEMLKRMGKRDRAAALEYENLTTQLDYKEAVKKIEMYVSEAGLSNGEFQVIGVYASSAGLITSTRDYSVPSKDNPYIGLHLDSWDNLPLEQRHKSRNRICINMGIEDRFFIFINLTLSDMFNSLKNLVGENVERYHPGELGTMFMSAYPNYPIIKLKIAPGEAYIAPTDNIIHDATSIDKQYCDIALTLIGNFCMLSKKISCK